MMPMFVLGAAGAVALIASGWLLNHDDHSKNHDPEASLRTSFLVAELKKKEEWDSHYLLGCHAKRKVADVHFCYEVLSKGVIEGFYEAFRHGNTLMTRYMTEPDDRLLEAAGWLISNGLSNYYEMQDYCDDIECPSDFLSALEEHYALVDSVTSRAAIVGATLDIND